MKAILASLPFLFLSMGFSAEQAFEKPGEAITDEAALLSPEQKARMLQLVEKAKASGIDLKVFLRTYLTSQERNRLLEAVQKQWFKDLDGAALIFARSDPIPSWGVSDRLRERLPYPVSVKIFANSPKRILEFQGGKNLNPIRGADLVNDFEFVVNALETEVSSEGKGDATSWTWVICLSAAVVAGLGAFLLGVMRPSQKAVGVKGHVSFFPPVRVGYRLGAPFGGGVMSGKDS